MATPGARSGARRAACRRAFATRYAHFNCRANRPPQSYALPLGPRSKSTTPRRRNPTSHWVAPPAGPRNPFGTSASVAKPVPELASRPAPQACPPGEPSNAAAAKSVMTTFLDFQKILAKNGYGFVTIFRLLNRNRFSASNKESLHTVARRRQNLRF